MDKTVNWGILGCAKIAETRFLPGLLKAKNAKLYAVASRTKSEKLRRFQEKFNPETVYESYEGLLNDPAVEAVYIPLPNGLHCEWVLKAAEKKKHILCEKPLGVSKAQVEQMVAACEKNGVLLMEAFAYRQSPLTLKAKSLIESGAVGTPQYIESYYGYPLNDLTNVRFSKALEGGATRDVGCYNINLIRYLANAEPLKISAFGRIGEQTGVDEESSVLMEFPNGLKAFSYCSLGIFRSYEYNVIGDRGRFQVPCEFNCKGDGKIILHTGKGIEEIEVFCPDNYMLEVEQFGRCVADGERPLITFEDSLGNAGVIDETLRQIYLNNASDPLTKGQRV